MKSERNKTIDLPLTEGRDYLERCIKVSEKCRLSEILDKTVLGDCFEVLPHLPEQIADLLIVDPPYNLSKDFHGSAFSSMSNEDYTAYTARWIEAVKPLLKPNASIYVCCDWSSSPVVGLVLQKHFKVLNRITWQREKGRGAKRN